MDLESSLTSRPIEHDHYQYMRAQIEQKFSSMEDTLRETKERLLAKLDSIVSKIKDKTQTYQQHFALLHEYKNHTEELLRSNKFNQFKTHQIGGINEKIGDIKQRYEDKIASIQIKWDENALKESIDKFCKITFARNHLARFGFRDYSQDLLPIKSFGSKGIQEKNLKDPAGIAIDPKSNNIFVADNTRNCVKVFSKEGEFIFQINDRFNMSGPYGLCIDDDLLYLSQIKSSSICMYRLDGTFLKKIGKTGSKEGEFILPLGLCTDPLNGDVYVCDSGNNRIQVFTRNLVFKRAFGIASLKRPRDVKINQNGDIIVLDSNEFCLHKFNREGRHLNQSIHNSNNTLELTGVREPLFFDIDRKGNAVISDVGNHSINVFKIDGEQIKVIGGYGKSKGEFINPQGLAIGMDGVIVSVCNRDENQIQLF